MKNFDNYYCDGQISLWDLFTESKEKLREVEPNDFVCEGCKWRKHKARELEVDEHGQTWVYKCPGTACANWRHGTPLNLSMPRDEIEDHEEHIYCYNRDFLPELKYLIPMVEAEFDCKFTEYTDFMGRTAYKLRYKKSEIEIHDSEYAYDPKDGVRFVSVSWEAPLEGSSRPCDNLHEVLKAVESSFNKADYVAEQRKKCKEKAYAEDEC